MWSLEKSWKVLKIGPAMDSATGLAPLPLMHADYLSIEFLLVVIETCILIDLIVSLEIDGQECEIGTIMV